MKWLLTGGAGYIGSHVSRSLLASGREVVVLDDLSTGLAERVPDGVALEQGSVCDGSFVTSVMRRHGIDGVIHLAAKKAVEESVAKPLWYFRENVGGILTVLESMVETGASRIVYSSSAAVYGHAEVMPVTEDSPTVPISPYGETKIIGEWAVADAAQASGLSWVALRYFNVAGAGSPDLGDTSVANLIPILLRNAAGGAPANVFGSDYPTPDGTCVRDYIHVSDLAEAHVAAAALMEEGSVREIVNVGTGRGSSVLEVIDSVNRALGRQIPVEIAERRPGDPPALVASAAKAREVLRWKAIRELDEMTSSALEAVT
ncbi:MAG: UDP-glucose 4-epimerase GalE [Candidatus Nanopelagicales bacterium]|nr:UDP-glucose 4-epimerase GalE [Candidatus Nanopelagicales bacterium]MDZ4248926.1 UDP-glucose 4-epimerase GalE [Candidatus Nanopelagicales bacterium]